MLKHVSPIAQDHPAAGLCNATDAAQLSPLHYEFRRLWADPVITVGPYRLKAYRLAHPGADLHSQVDWGAIGAALGPKLPKDEDAFSHRLGFAIIHAGRDGHYLLFGTWCGGNMLQSGTYMIEGGASGIVVRSLAERRLHACVWELVVFDFERDAWVHHEHVNDLHTTSASTLDVLSQQ